VRRNVVITGVGRDRIGIVAELTDLLFSSGCNLMDSSMTLLRGEFALILMAQLPEGLPTEDLQEQLSQIESRMGLRLHVRELDEEELQHQDTSEGLHIISVYGADKPGIVAGVTRKLSELAVNITDVQTRSTGAAGKPVFVMILEAVAPASLSTEQLQQHLKECRSNLNVDITVQALEVAEL
jgi:glycine cleavage system transcriptional repressor